MFPLASDDEAKSYIYKNMADFYRYAVEGANEQTIDETKQNTCDQYANAEKFSATLSSSHPVKLGLILNSSVFHYEVMEDHKKAINMTEKGLKDALKTIDSIEEELFRDSKAIIELLKENLQLWNDNVGSDEDQ